MDAAEKTAVACADTVYLGVGLDNGCGSARRMYAKRGNIPDGSGVWYPDKPCTPCDMICTNDGDLVLYLSKRLSGSQSPADGCQKRKECTMPLLRFPAC